MWTKILWVLLLAIGIWLYQRYVDYKRKQKELDERRLKELEENKRALHGLFKSHALNIQIAVNEFNYFRDHRSGYFNNYKLTKWKAEYEDIFHAIKDKEYHEIPLEKSERVAVRQFLDAFSKGEIYRNEYNQRFIISELDSYANFFDNIEGHKLDTQQRKAIVTDEDNNLIIAGAGSGKTTTIIGKVAYVVDRYKASADEILLISYTNRSASTLSSRLQIDGVEAKTFHKFGKDIIATVEGKQPSVYDDKQFKPFIIHTFNRLIKEKAYLEKVTKYFTGFIKREKSQFEFQNQDDYYQFLKDYNIRPYNLVQSNGRQTFYREIVKSIEECKIANFLLFHGLNYKYEYPYEHDTATPKHSRWKPDFTVTQNGKTVYIEHFAINRNDDVPPFFAKPGETYQEAKDKYWEKINWARQTNEEYDTILIETYSYEMFEGTLFDNLKNNLTSQGFILELKSPEEIWNIIREAAKDEVQSFITLFQTFITLMKSNNYTISDLVLKGMVINGTDVIEDFSTNRNQLFLEIVSPIYDSYEQNLAIRGEIDFSDMINKATAYILDKSYHKNFSHIIIDEFQDISIGRYQLLKAIKSANPSCKLFSVGDDWQSIYRFSGSDIALFKEFESFFGFTVKSKIETTYRFHNPLLKLTSDFIQRNPNQAQKELKGASNFKSTNFEIVYSLSEAHNPDDTVALKATLDKLFELDSNLESKSILVLGRYNFDIDRIKNHQNVFEIDKTQETPSIRYVKNILKGRGKTINLRFMTVHKAKGLEADIVIVINCNSGNYGFPSEMSDDPVLNLLLSESDQYENGEERRLFYVAMTRAKERVYLIADSSTKSKFIKELEVESADGGLKKCPNCKSADLVKRAGVTNGRKWEFYACSNSLYGCDFHEWIN